jgi:hypothetical protein
LLAAGGLGNTGTRTSAFACVLKFEARIFSFDVLTMKSKSLLVVNLSLGAFLLLFCTETRAFQHSGLPLPSARPKPSLVSNLEASAASEESNAWLDEFKTANGEIINPYKVLKVSREAERREIRNSYINLSRRYHPDGARHRDILPGSW